jgi:hypothetical protein
MAIEERRTHMRKRTLVTIGAAAVSLAAGLLGASPIQAEETPTADLVIGYPPSCDDADAVTNAEVECAGLEAVDSIGEISPEIQNAAAETARIETALVAAEGPNALRRNCRFHSEVALYSPLDWNRLAQTLAAEASHCADYYVMVPAPEGNKTMPRVDQAWRIRALGPRFHAMAEAHLTGWQAWVIANNKTWVEAGREFRRRMAAAGYDVSQGDLWAMNEVPASVRQNAGSARRNLLDFLKGLDEGDGSTAPTKGLVFIVGFGQRTQNLSVYLGNLRSWLSDSGFWAEADGYVRFWAQEVYGDVRAWAVPDTPRMTRANHVIDYVMHPHALAVAGGDRTSAAASFLARAYVPVANAAWRYQSGFGFTDVDHVVMQHFLSEQVHAVRHDAGTRPDLGPEGRLGFAWAPRNTGESEFPAKTALILKRLASAFANAYAQGASSQIGACGPPGDHVWCEGTLEGAVFNDGWSAFSSWD